MKIEFSNVLVLAPHTDDGELGCGGTISRFIEQEANVTYATFSTAETSVPAGYPKDVLKTEVRGATKALGIRDEDLLVFDYEVRKLGYVRQEVLEDMIRIRSTKRFDLVLMPCLNDIHQDHATVATEALRAFKTTSILGYELIWNNLTFNTTAFVKLESRHIERKVSALSEYRSQQGRDYMSPEFIRSLARTRGVQIGAPFAECFEVVRWIVS